MKTSSPAISIITICRNEINNISRTVESVIAQKFLNFEYIVIDGNSTDGTAEYLKDKSASIDSLIVEKDNGIYDAMNKGIKIARGEYIYFLNGGDYFYDGDVLDNVISHSQKNTSSDIIHCKLAFCQEKGKIYYMDDSRFKLDSLFDLFKYNHLQQCFFIKRKVFGQLGLLNDRYKFVADSEFIIRAFRKKISFSYLPIFVCVFDTNGISSQLPQARLKEKRLMILKTAPSGIFFIYLVYGVRNFILSLFKPSLK